MSLFRPTLAGLHTYVPSPSQRGHRLHLNESPADLPQDVKEAATARLLAMSWSQYPEATQSLYEALAARDGWRADGVLAGNGSNEMLQVLLYATLMPGDAIVLAAPSFSVYATQARVAGARVVEVPMRAGPDAPFRFEVPALVREARKSKAKLILVGSPNNPTGTPLTLDEIRALHDETDGLVAIDEAYRHFAAQDLVPLLADRPRLLLMRTFSKSYAAAALRLGYVLTSPTNRDELLKVAMPYNVSAVSCVLATELLARPDLVQARVQHIVSERERVNAALASVSGLRVERGLGNFVVFEHATRPAKVLVQGLAARGVLARDLSGYAGCDRCVRANIGTTAANDALLAAVRELA
jgi:histidinol-phosphate aminotransferase